MGVTFEPIGTFRSDTYEKYQAPRQPLEGMGESQGCIELIAGLNLEQALDDLIGFSHIWILGHFHRATSWRPKIAPPRNPGHKVGCLASRSPHRPNSILMSVVPLIKIEGRKVWVGYHDLLDGTPILDIKPYIDYCDRIEGTRQGWLDAVSDMRYHTQWSDIAEEQRSWLLTHGVDIGSLVQNSLEMQPHPKDNPRVRLLKNEENGLQCQLAVKTWRLNYKIEMKGVVRVHEIKSGYKDIVLHGQEDSLWDDVPLHRRFIQQFYS